MINIKLSICIATYNRSGFLKIMLDSIYSQNFIDVEIIIVDSSDNFETAQMITDNFHGFVNYIKLDSKGGVDKDYDICVSKANGEYCWLLTDDDIIMNGSIMKILDHLNLDIYSILVINSELRSRDLSEVYRNKQLVYSTDRVFNNTLDEYTLFFKEVSNYLSFIGCLIIKKEIWIERERLKYYGSEFIHLGVIFQKQLPEKILIISEPYISIRMNNSLWTSRAFKIWFVNWPKLINSFHLFTQSDRKSVVSIKPLSQIIKLLYYRALGVFGFEEYKLLVSTYSLNFFEKLGLKVILYSNKTILSYFMIIYSIIFNRKWMSEDLKVRFK